jgi:hypothetical protein
MPRGTKGHALLRHRNVRRLVVISGDEAGHIDQHLWFGRLTGIGADGHFPLTDVRTISERPILQWRREQPRGC